MSVRIKKYKFFELIVMMLCSILLLNCSEEKKHDILTFLFDGVPPLGQKALKNELVNADFRTTSQVPEGPVWYVHEPRKDCTNCHDKSRQKNMSPQTYLKAPVPQLCYNCHSDYSSNQYVHGPVAVGQCLYCHNPHASQIKYLLIKSEPELCYKCHDQYAVELIPGHFSKQMSTCTNCHNPHSSSIGYLLKVNPNRINEINGDRGSEQVNTAHQTPDRENVLQIFSNINKLIDKGDLQKARIYLLQYKDSTAFNNQEREKISEILKLIDDTLVKSNRSGSEKPASELESGDSQSSSKAQEIADLYYRSLQFYRDGRLIEARNGFIRVINSGTIPPAMEKTIRDYLSDIENRLSNQDKQPGLYSN